MTKKYTILIVDDNTSTAKMLNSVLTSYGYDTIVCHNGTDALEIANEKQPDLILLDLMMPGVDGFEVLEHLRHHERTEDLPVMMVTAIRNPASIEQGMDLGANDYITKPFDTRELVAKARSKIESYHLKRSLKTQTKRLEALLTISEQLNMRHDIHELIEIIPFQILDLLPVTTALVYYLNTNNDIREFASYSRAHTPPIIDHELMLSNFINQTEVTFWQPDGLSLIPNHPHGLISPILLDQQNMGCIVIGMDEEPDQSLIRIIVGVTQQAQLALYNAQLLEIKTHTAEQLEILVNERTNELKSTQQLLFRSEKLAAIGRLSAGIAHEINNPLMPIIVNLEGIIEDLEQGVDLDLKGVEEALTSAKRIQRTVKRLLQFTRPDNDIQLIREGINIDLILENVLALVRKTLEQGNVQLETSFNLSATVYGNRDQLEQVFLNLIINAIAAMPQGGTLTTKTWQDKQSIYVEIQDSGIGIKAETIERLFEPFTTTKSNGTGLGLFICHGIIDQHHGHIFIESEVGQGSIFTVQLPIHK
ncbi:GAF domain-containing sensor histidine kinase [Anaerolineales bacterium]